MSLPTLFRYVKWRGRSVVLCALVLGLVIVPVAFGGKEPPAISIPPRIPAFQPGESLAYDVSWSNVITAGTATMEVTEERLPDGRAVLAFVMTGRTLGLVDSVYPVHDTVRSVFDPRRMESLSLSLKESYGGKKRRRELVFDHARNTVVSTLNDDPPETLSVPDRVQDALSALYVLRTREELTTGKVINVDIHESGKNWSVEVQTLGRERVNTPDGEFSTIKVKTYPTYQGVFMNKGVVFLWLTDDSRKIPVLMKSTLAVGSFVFTLRSLKPEYPRVKPAP
jgi:hypothetical protein